MDNTLVSVIDGHTVTTSHQIAETFEKLHKDVLKKIDALECSEEFRRRNFAPTFQDIEMPNGATRKDKFYNVTRDGFTLLAMGFTGKKAMAFKEAYIAAFNQMEQHLLIGNPPGTGMATSEDGTLTILEFKGKPLRLLQQGGVRWWVLPDVEAATDTRLSRALRRLTHEDHQVASIPVKKIDAYDRITHYTIKENVVTDNGLKQLLGSYINAGVNAFLTWGKGQWLTRPDQGVCSHVCYDPNEFFLVHKSSLDSGACVCTTNEWGTLTTSPVSPESMVMIKAASNFIDAVKQEGYHLIKPEDLLKKLAL